MALSEFQNDYSKFETGRLLFIRSFYAKEVIGPLRGKWADDPRAEDSLRLYQGEMEKINAELRKRWGPPEDIVVGVQALELRGLAKGD